MILLKYLVVASVFTGSTILFRRAAGSLKLTRLNMISLIYYFIIIMNFAGASLVYVGLRDHYLIRRIKDAAVINHTFYALAYTVIMFPLTLLLVKRFFSYLTEKKALSDSYSFRKTYVECDMWRIQGIVILGAFVCTVSIIYVFTKLGYVPFFEMFSGGDINVLRQSGSRYFIGNQYVKNLLMLAFTPYLSYFSYIYFRLTREKKWGILFGYLCLLSIIALTYDFSKSPIINYMIGFYLIEVVLGNVKSNKKILRLGGTVATLILFFYIVMLKGWKSLFSIYTGPIGRILFTQIATLFLHFDAFPLRHPYLHGASFNHWMSFLITNADGLRSGRVVMSIYNAEGIADGSAGVMNTIFVGEAFANYGWIGIIVAPIIFGCVIGIAAYVLPMLRKRPAVILLYIQLCLQFVTIIEGGFVDIFYSASIIFYILLALMFDLIASAPQMYRKKSTIKNEKDKQTT